MELNDKHVHTPILRISIQQNDKATPSRAFLPQVKIFSACLLAGVSVGMSLGHTAVLLPQLQSSNSSLHVDENTGSWIASLYAGAGPLGSIVGGIAMDRWGRRNICFLANLGMFAGWLLICVAQCAFTLIAGKTIEGFARSMLATAMTVLVDELADPKFRGFSLCAGIVSSSVGVMAIASLGALMDWRTASEIAAVISLLSVSPFLLLHESPSWLVRKNLMEEAARSLKWLWGPDRETEPQEDLEFLKSRYSSKQQESQSLKNLRRTCKSFFTPRILKPFLILHVFNTIQAFCGITIFTFYTIDILSKMTEVSKAESLNENLSAIVMSFMRIMGTVASTIMIIRIGRRSIALISGIGSSIFALSLGVMLILQSTQSSLFSSSQTDAWIDFTLTVFFVFFNSFGFLLLPVLMLGETQSAHARGFVCGYIYTMNDLVLGGILKFFPMLLHNIEIYGLFLLFGMSCLICTVFVYLFLPETQGKTLEQIEDYFREPNVMWITRNKKQPVN